MIQIQDKKDCCGCAACASICAHGAITMRQDERGFAFPQVNSELCVNCSLCEMTCPMLSKGDSKEPMSSYIASAIDVKEQHSSTSGGIASVCARYVIEQLSGVVYGCTGEDCFNVRHIRIDSELELKRIKGSKYVQSNLSGIYRQIRKDLKDGLHVLFVGTPCQVSALRRFFRKPQERLYCLDFVCHGVPPQPLLSSAIKEHVQGLAPSSVSFRVKEDGKPSRYCLKVASHDGTTLYKKYYGSDLYITGFIYALFYRDSCYACPFACLDRVGDLTLGDFWDRGKEYRFMEMSEGGLSQVHINTEKGERLFNKLREYIRVEQIEIGKLLLHSEQLSHPMPRHRNNALFWRLYYERGFNAACREALCNEIRWLKYQKYTNVIFSIPGVKPLYFALKNLLKR